MSRPRARHTTFFVAALCLVLSARSVAAQADGSLRPLSMDDYDRWRTVEWVELSDHGRWMTYGYDHRLEEDTLVVRSLEGEDTHRLPDASGPVFSDDDLWLAYELDDDEGGGGLLSLTTGASVTWTGVSTLRFSPGSRYLAVHRRPGDDEADHRGADLILRDLSAGSELPLGNVAEWAFNEAGTQLAYTVDAADQLGNGLYVMDLTAGTTRVLDNDLLLYSSLTWDPSGTAVAVLKGETPEGQSERANSLVVVQGTASRDPTTLRFSPDAASGFPAGYVLSERGGLEWRQDGSMILVGLKDQSTPAPDPVSSVVVFHWQDDYLQTVQERMARFQVNQTFRAGVHVPSGRFVQLADSTMARLTVPAEGRWGVGSDDRAYISDWEESRADYYRVDLTTGERTRILEAQMRTLGLSPDGRWFAFWRDGDVWVYDLRAMEERNLTASAPVSFVDEEWDHPGTPPPYGVAGWTADGSALVLNHRYDLWRQPLDGSVATNLTGGRGDDDEIRFRYVRTDDDRTIDLDAPVLLSAYGEWTKKAGYFELEGGRLRERIFQDRRFGDLRKAAQGDRMIFTASTFREFPDYWVTDTRFSSPRRITDANPQQAEYRWGERILFDFHNEDGVRLQGTLAIPDGYEAGQKLPMIVSFYEKKSQDMHMYYTPRFESGYPSGNVGPVAEHAAWVSNGYLVMQLDVHFNTGTTHSDMLDCVEAATRRVIEMGYADPERIALTGGSFSGGGSAFIAARSNMFAAVAARAAPINLAGEFNILFSGSGQNNHSYDIYGQGRYGTNPFDDFELYREQSPITHVETMDTPLLYLHGAQDPSVEYLQGMEFYNALRFLGKPIIFLSYADDGHNLHRYENQWDYTGRLWQFLDHYLKDAPAPDWMVHGLPYAQRGR